MRRAMSFAPLPYIFCAVVFALQPGAKQEPARMSANGGAAECGGTRGCSRLGRLGKSHQLSPSFTSSAFAWAFPFWAAFLYHSTAMSVSFGTPLPLR